MGDAGPCQRSRPGLADVHGFGRVYLAGKHERGTDALAVFEQADNLIGNADHPCLRVFMSRNTTVQAARSTSAQARPMVPDCRPPVVSASRTDK